MKKLTKISIAALLALFLAACDQPAQSSKTESATSASVVTSEAQGIEDFKKFVEWNLAQEQALASSHAELQQKLATEDKAQLEQGLTEFTVKVSEVLKSLDALDVKHNELVAFKAKTKESLTLSNEVISESVKLIANPTEEGQKIIQEKTAKLQQVNAELQQLQLELQQKFGAK